MLGKFYVTGRILGFAMVAALAMNGLSLAKITEIESREEPTYIEMVPGDNKKLMIDHDLKRIVVGDPNIIEIKVLSKNRIGLIAKGIGNSSITLNGPDEADVTSIYVHVAPDVIALKQRISQLFPGQNIRIYANKNGIILAGSVSGAEVVEQVLRLTEQMLASPGKEQAQPQVEINRQVSSTATDEELAQIIADTSEISVDAKKKSGSSTTGKSSVTITNLMQVGGSQQVLLEVKLAEVNRESTRELQAGIGLGGLGSDFSGGISSSSSVLTNFDTTGLSGVIPGGKIGSLVDDISIPGLADAPGTLFMNLADGANIFINIDNFTAMLRFVESERLGRILAEPKLVTMSGQEASFLAGGQFPFQEIDNNGNIGIEFKDFGVGLKFTPIVQSDGTITLKVAPSVTDIDQLVETSTGPQPVFSTRKLESTVQLRDGQTLALAGLLQENLTEVVNKVPFLGDIPYLGALFRSSNYQQSKTDLLVAVTPHLISPVREGDISFPGEFIKPPNRHEFYLEGRLEGRRTSMDPSQIQQHNFARKSYSEAGGLEGDFGHSDAAQ
jgi:pilus assembly protein CpaC